GDGITFHLPAGENNNSLFTLDTNGTLRTATTFDYETNASSYTITVQAKDELNATTEGNFTVTLQNVVEDLDQDGTEDHFDDDIDGDGFTNVQELAYGSDPLDKNSVANAVPTDLNTSSNLSILENLPPGEWVAEFNATDSDFNSTLKYSLVVGDGSLGNSFFTVDENGTLRTSQELNYEAKSKHTIRVRVSDEHNASIEKSFTIKVEDMDEGVAPSLGNGSEQDPYQINTLAHLKWLSFSNSIHDGKHFIQTSDINASETKSWSNGYGFRPIGNIYGYFRAQYNGNRHKIFGLFFNRPQQQRSAGFISILRNSTLKNISIVDGNVTGFDGVGGLVGTLESNSSLKHSSFEGSVAGGIRVGGLVGRTAISFIENSFSVGIVSSLYNEAGGIVGANGANSTVSDSYSHAEVSGGGIFGGVAGFNVHGASIKRSFSTGNVPKFSSSGGLVGSVHKSSISSSFWDINASGQSASAGEGAVGKSTVEMMTPNTFIATGWDFNLNGGTWKMIAGQTYPYLAWEDLPNTPPFDLNTTAPLQVSENQPSGVVVGQFSAKDLDVPSLLTFSLVEGLSDNDLFSLDANGTLRTGKKLDYESNVTLRIGAKVSDQHNASIAQTFTIKVLNVVEDFDNDGVEDHFDTDDDNDGFSDEKEIAYGSDPFNPKSVANAPPVITLKDEYPEQVDKNGVFHIRIPENQTDIIQVTATDLDKDDLNFSIYGWQDLEHFEINASTGSLRFNHAPNFEKPRDHDTDNKFGIFLRVSDGRVHQDQPVYIHVDDQNEAPVYFDAVDPLRVLENQPIGTIVGELEAIDDDEGDVVTYQLLKDRDPIANESFTLDENGTLRTAEVLDYEKNASLFIRAKATDKAGLITKKRFVVEVINVVEDLDGDGKEDAHDDDMDGDGIEDAVDEDRDGDGFSNEQEIEEGTDPNNQYSHSNKPILRTQRGVIDENGSIYLSGSVLADGKGRVDDFGFVISSGISIDPQKSKVYWVRGVGDISAFKLKVTQSPFEPIMYFRAWAKNTAGYGIGPVKKVRIPEAPKPWWGEVAEGAGGWLASDWFGTFKYYEQGWLYHARLGWLYSSPAKENSVWLWRENQGWLWTKEDAWPYLWSHQSGGWLYLYPGKIEETPRFYDYSTEIYR
ncbi:cadherin domain-containing protein, partial [Opitutales bacterium]|nr:cadherin domain-containing protein [Opitutales bacterium]